MRSILPVVRILGTVILAMTVIAGCSAAATPPSAATPAAAQLTSAPGVPDTGATQAPTTQSKPAVVFTQPPASQTPAAATQASPSSTAACTSPAALTPAVTEGPYFKAGSPETTALQGDGAPGVKLTLSGLVMTADCQPVAHALLDFWQADAQGKYDNSGYTYRGHQYTDASGRYQLVTVVPGLYPGRTEHIHVKVQAPNGPLLTTQLFFPGVTGNSKDGIYNPALLIGVQSSDATTMLASFNFIVSSK